MDLFDGKGPPALSYIGPANPLRMEKLLFLTTTFSEVLDTRFIDLESMRG